MKWTYRAEDIDRVLSKVLEYEIGMQIKKFMFNHK